jgi:type IV pilus assembly protein PilY1
MSNFLHKFQLIIGIAIIGMAAGAPLDARAADLNIANSPLFVATNVEPNVMFTLDDSGSMQWEYMPDGGGMDFSTYMFPRLVSNLYGGNDYGNQVPNFDDDNVHNFYGRSSANNGVFYNPDVTYSPWSRPDGTEMPPADPTNALYNPDQPALGGRDLTTQRTENACWFRHGSNLGSAFGDPCTGNHTYWPITYFIYNGGSRTVRGNYTKIEITTATPAGQTFTSPGGETRTRDEEIQNFANWFQYHRSRILTSRGAIGRAFTQMPDQARVGFAAINAPGSLISEVADFNIGGRNAFYNSLYNRTISTSGTPLRRAANSVGQYFERTDDAGPWSTTPGASGGEDLACRQSFNILMSDGFWNGGNPGVGEADGAAGATITGPDLGAGPQSYTYTPTAPFADASRTNTLADVAMHYWKRDLRPGLANKVSTTPEDPAFWQHLTSFGIGLGVEGNVIPQDAFDAVDNGTNINWGNPFGGNPDKIDDLLHYGINGRGGFFSAADPETFAEELGNLLLEIVARTAATTGLSVSTTRLTQDSVAFAAEFDSEDWSGEVKAIDVINDTTEWEASPALNSRDPAFREIYTSEMDGTGGVDFDTGLTGAHKALIDSDTSRANNVIRYVRGESITGFRNRTNILGDIVNSRPVFVGQSNEGWANLPAGQGGGSSYFTFVDSKEAKTDAVYLGANDGMLHAFKADPATGGDELFAFVPRTVFGKLGELTEEPYGHQFFVDGQQVVRDAHDGSWKRVLVGTLGAGGRGVYALDVTDANNPEVLWEMNSGDDVDLGFTFGEPIITRLGNDDWVAIFGNGYNSDDNDAVMFVVNLFDGTVRDKIVLETSSDSNGLSGVAPVLDPETRMFTRRVYAGDLQGTIWRVDFDDSGSASVKYGSGLFTDPDNRPITSAPELALRASGGVAVFFGTGKLIEPQDRLTSTTEMERLYAVIDRESALTSPDLGEPTMNDLGGGEREIIGASGQDGWVLDLSPSATPTGERALAAPVVVLGRVVFSTFEPEDDPCAPGGIQRLYLLDAFDGGGELPTCQNCGVVEIGIGAPIVPPIVIGDPATDDPSGDASNPFDTPIDPGDLPDGTSIGVASGWCRQVQTLNPATGKPLSIGPICDGRQVWRQAR